MDPISPSLRVQTPAVRLQEPSAASRCSSLVETGAGLLFSSPFEGPGGTPGCGNPLVESLAFLPTLHPSKDRVVLSPGGSTLPSTPVSQPVSLLVGFLVLFCFF